MLKLSRKDGIVTIEMNEKDAKNLASIIHEARPSQMLTGYGMKELAEDLQEFIENPDTPNSEEDALVIPHYWFHQERGDLFICNWVRNDPKEPGWVPISQTVYEFFFGRVVR